MIARYIVARNDAEDLCWVAEWLLVAGIEERGIAGIETRGDRPYSKISGYAAPFDREFS